MTGEDYRVLATNMHERAKWESSLLVRAEFENLARYYLRLATLADQNAKTNIVYEPPASKQA